MNAEQLEATLTALDSAAAQLERLDFSMNSQDDLVAVAKSLKLTDGRLEGVRRKLDAVNDQYRALCCHLLGLPITTSDDKLNRAIAAANLESLKRQSAALHPQPLEKP